MYKKVSIIISFIIFLPGCGFQLRGAYPIPVELQTLKITPHQPLDNFQRTLRPLLKSNHVNIVDNLQTPATLELLSQDFTEKVVSYGSDGRANRAVITFSVQYQLLLNGKPLSETHQVNATRELTIDPNNYLATDHERNRLKTDLYLDAASQLIRQFSIISSRGER